jgi:alpha-mannosidase
MLKKNGASMATISICGHSHIDIAWLWSRDETTRKFSRTFSTVLNQMGRYPQFNFVQTQAYIYETVKKKYPRLFAGIKNAVKKRRWMPESPVWVEMDCNVTSGESFVRQFLFGKRLTKKLFNHDSKVLLLPDVFGYSAALPQILKKCGVDYFVTAKIGWNDTNRFPHTTFNWRGIDGTETFTHLMSYGTYIGKVKPEILKKNWDAVTDKKLQDEQFLTVGYGDGGGGPNEADNEMALRLKDLEGCFKVKFVKLEEYLRRLRLKRDDYPLYDGELYLETHRGTLTSQAQIKRYNRKLEFKLRDTELLGILAMRKGGVYPGHILEKAWKTVLVNQFHDIIPGSSIQAVNEQTVREYREVMKTCGGLIEKSINSLGKKEKSAVTVLNTLGHDRKDLCLIPDVPKGYTLQDEKGETVECQTCNANRKNDLYAYVPIKGLAAQTLKLVKKSQRSRSNFNFKNRNLLTPFYKVRFDRSYRISSLVLRENSREIVPGAKVINDIRYSDDVAYNYITWDIEKDYMFKEVPETRLARARVVADGPLFLNIRIERSLARNSRIIQDIIFYSRTRRIDFKTRVHWNEKNTLLRAYFPVDVHTSRAKFEIQFGHLERNTHDNTSYESAQFEVAAHKWADLSEDDFGVALLNDCKYGHKVKDGVMSISLLKSSDRPDARREQGLHEMTWSLYPHRGNRDLERVIQQSYELNVPCMVKKGLKAEFDSLLSVNSPGVIIDTVKKAEDSKCVIVRLYQALNRREKIKLSVPANTKKIYECDLLEKELRKCRIFKGAVSLTIKPFEIKTFKFG